MAPAGLIVRVISGNGPPWRRLRGDKTMTRYGLLAVTLVLLGSLCVGCEKTGGAERFGKTFYLDGAGNWGFGAGPVPEGLRKAGYKGDVEIFVWTTSFNPLVDQLVTINAKLKADMLAGKIKNYAKKYPGRSVNIIALSAGTGVAMWAVEALPPDVHINNMVLLGSSLSNTYDIRKVVPHIEGSIYVYYSRHDAVLDAVRVIGTIDGKRGVDSAGQVGLHPAGGYRNKVVNIGWSRQYMALGWAGAHTDCTNETFVRHEIAKRLMRGSGVTSDRRGQTVTLAQATDPSAE